MIDLIFNLLKWEIISNLSTSFSSVKKSIFQGTESIENCLIGLISFPSLIIRLSDFQHNSHTNRKRRRPAGKSDDDTFRGANDEINLSLLDDD